MNLNRTFLLFSGLALLLLLIVAGGNLRPTPVVMSQPNVTPTPESFLPYIAKEPTWTPTPTTTGTITPIPTITPTPTLTPVARADFFCQWAPFVEWEFNEVGVFEDTLTIDETGEIVDLVLYLNIAHTYVGDLIIEFEHVDTNTIIEVMNRPGSEIIQGLGCPSNHIGAFLDDAASGPVEDGCANYQDGNFSPALSGDLRPNEPLSSFDGEDLSGDWTLYVEDVIEADGGMINAWCIFADYGG